MRTVARMAVATAAVGGFLALAAGPAAAHECINASKPANAGVRVLVSIVDGQEQLLFQNAGLERQFMRNPEVAMERFSGLIGFDEDGDGAADFSTYIVGPEGEIPLQAQLNGAECRGIVNIVDYFGCVGA